MNDAQTLVLPAAEAQPNLQTGSIYFIGTATVLLRYAGFTVLTDPNFLHRGQVVHLGYGLRSVRRTNPAVTMAELPPIDLVVLSHRHEDHFDREVTVAGFEDRMHYLSRGDTYTFEAPASRLILA